MNAANRNDNSTQNAYKKESLEVFKSAFPSLSVACIQSAFHSCSYQFTPSYRTLQEIDRLTRESPEAARHQDVLDVYPFLGPLQRVVLKFNRQCKPPNLSNQNLLTEMQAFPEFQTKQKANYRTRSKENLPPLIVGASSGDDVVEIVAVKPAASLVSPTERPPTECELTCECCFGDYPFEEMVACSEGSHLFCKTCLKEYVRENLYGNNRSDFPCMSSDGCSATFDKNMFEKALSPRLLQNVEKHAFRAQIVKSGVQGLWSCPNCEYLAVAEGDLFLECPSCYHKSCRLCLKAPHPNQTCKAAEEEKQKANAHARMADAMTDAIIRLCPGCNSKIVKSEGCNKMVCSVTACRTTFCYVCRKKITGYDHFCRAPHCTHETCGKCQLFSNTEEDDRRARQEAGAKEKAALGDAAKDVKLLSPEKDTTTNGRREANNGGDVAAARVAERIIVDLGENAIAMQAANRHRQRRDPAGLLPGLFGNNINMMAPANGYHQQREHAGVLPVPFRNNVDAMAPANGHREHRELAGLPPGPFGNNRQQGELAGALPGPFANNVHMMAPVNGHLEEREPAAWLHGLFGNNNGYQEQREPAAVRPGPIENNVDRGAAANGYRVPDVVLVRNNGAAHQNRRQRPPAVVRAGLAENDANRRGVANVLHQQRAPAVVRLRRNNGDATGAAGYYGDQFDDLAHNFEHMGFGRG